MQSRMDEDSRVDKEGQRNVEPGHGACYAPERQKIGKKVKLPW